VIGGVRKGWSGDAVGGGTLDVENLNFDRMNKLDNMRKMIWFGKKIGLWGGCRGEAALPGEVGRTRVGALKLA
jgi:hypothetical protein